MKIVVFGPERRLGALAADRVIDLNRGFARYLQYRGDRHPNEQAGKHLLRICDLSSTAAPLL